VGRVKVLKTGKQSLGDAYSERIARGRLCGARIAQGRTRMIVLPLTHFVGLKEATASSRVDTLPMFVRSRPSRTRWTLTQLGTIGLDNEADRQAVVGPHPGRPTTDTSVEADRSGRRGPTACINGHVSLTDERV